MKKIILSIFCCLPVLLSINKCSGDKRQLVDEKSVINYLNEVYPNETFEIISKEKIDITHDNCGGDKEVLGNSWLVKSNNTGIEFNVKDSYRFNSFYCKFGIDSNYVSAALEQKSKQNTNTKLHFSYNTIDVYEKEFSSKSEMVNTLYSTINDMKNETPFNYGNNGIHIHICLNDRDSCKTLHFDEISNKEYITNIINN